MTDTPQTKPHSLLYGISLRQIRMACGVVLFVYLISHLLNHSLGNISPEALDAGLSIHMTIWQFPPVAIAFYAAALVHTGLGIWALYERRQFHWRAIEPLQLLLGLTIPALIVAHIVGMRFSYALFGLERGYDQAFYSYWVGRPYKMWLFCFVIVVSWVHGCIGLYFWLRLKLVFRRAAPYLLVAAVILPTLALLGLYQGGRNVVRESAATEWVEQNISPQRMGTPAQQAVLQDVADGFLFGYLALLGLALVARGVRALTERGMGLISLSYGDGRTIRVPKGLTVLEASLRHHVPHTSICGGRARCSTCRIRVLGDHSGLPVPSRRELYVLNRLGSDLDPSIRLACQLRPKSDLSFIQIFNSLAATARAQSAASTRISQERYLVSMFVDMRGSTGLAEKRLPFDTVFIVNRFLSAVSQAILASGGQPNQFVGDGMLALFGLDTDPETACRQALMAAATISVNIDGLNEFLEHDLREPIRFGIGIHAGEVIVGDIGYRDHMVFTALGDAVNVAARLQDMTKGLGCECIVSAEVCETAGVSLTALPIHEVTIRGRSDPLIVGAVSHASFLSSLVVESASLVES